jgi:hypothetical protein
VHLHVHLQLCMMVEDEVHAGCRRILFHIWTAMR